MNSMDSMATMASMVSEVGGYSIVARVTTIAIETKATATIVAM